MIEKLREYYHIRKILRNASLLLLTTKDGTTQHIIIMPNELLMIHNENFTVIGELDKTKVRNAYNEYKERRK